MGYTHGEKWTEQKIEEKINEIVQTYNMKTFPTHSEMDNYCGSRALSGAVSKHGGTRYFASKMNLPIKTCESEFGNIYELKAIEDIFLKTGLKAAQTKPRYPYDLIVNDHIKVDVKVSRPSNNGSGTLANTFNLEKSEPTCDIFIFYCLKISGEIYKTLIIPSCVLKGQTQLGVGLLSKWDVFSDKWEYFKTFSDFNKFILTSIVIPSRRRSKDVDWV